MKNLLLIICLLLSYQVVSAQDHAIFSHYQVSPILVNPAYAGFDNEAQVIFNARAQWTGFPDAPQTIAANFNTRIGKVFGVGLGVISESAARMTRVGARANFGFAIPLGEQSLNTLSFGFSTELQQQSLGSNTLFESFYELGDNIIEGAVDGKNFFDASFGVFGRFYFNNDEDHLFAGVTLTNLAQTRLDQVVTEEPSSTASFLEHYLIMAGYRFSPGGDGNSFYIEPSIMLRQIENAPFQTDFNLRAGFGGDILVAGVSYRTIKAIGVMLGTDFGNSNNNDNRNSGLRFFYTFDLSTQEFQRFTSGSHEITLAFGFGGGNKKN